PTAIMSVCRLGTYGALVVSHQDNSTWAFYGEYDGGTFVTFDKHVCDALRAESDETTEVSGKQAAKSGAPKLHVPSSN
ncbi:MAG: hypothetical protein AB8H86_18260, partial [Polyangiales bacterium]